MTKNYMLERLVKFYSRLGVEVALNYDGVVRLHHDRIKDDCYYPSITRCYQLTFGTDEINPDFDGYKFYVMNLDGLTTPPFPL